MNGVRKKGLTSAFHRGNMPPMNLISIPQFTTAQVADAARVPYATLQSWMARDILLIGRAASDPALVDATRGKVRLWSIQRAIHVAIVAELVNLGFSPSRAAEDAAAFTDIGQGPSGWVGEQPDDSDERNPCELFPYPEFETVLIVANDGAEHFRRLLKIPPKGKGVFEIVVEIGHRFTRHAFAMVHINELAVDTLARLGVDRDLLSHRRTKK